MFPVASIFHGNTRLNRDGLFRVFQEAGFASRPHLWQGLTLNVEQVRYTEGCDICFQVDDEPDGIAEDILELAQIAEHGVVPHENATLLRNCTARIMVLPFQPDASEDVYRDWLANGVRAEVPAAATLDNPNVRRVVEAVATRIGGVVYDHIEDRLI